MTGARLVDSTTLHYTVHRTLNLRNRGMIFTLDHGVPIMKQFEFELRNLSISKRKYKVKAVVVRVESLVEEMFRITTFFVEVPQEAEEMLNQFVKKREGR